jgi:hypothetical protein
MDHGPFKSHTFSSETLASMDAAFNSVWEAILPDTNDSNRDLVRDVITTALIDMVRAGQLDQRRLEVYAADQAHTELKRLRLRPPYPTPGF